MFKVCNSKLQIVSEWATLAAAKASAEIRGREYPEQVFFVCDEPGNIVAGFGGAKCPVLGGWTHS